jgi:large subunit ribosomal protein L24
MSVKTNTNKKIRKGDKVKVIAGNYRGQVGTVIKRDAETVTVQGVNVRKKHVKPTQQGQKGNILSIERPIHISNVMLCVEDDKTVKLKVKTAGKDHHKVFYFNDGKKEVTYRPVRKAPA